MLDLPFQSAIEPGFAGDVAFQHYPSTAFPSIHPVHWLHSHFAVGGWSPLQRLSGMLTAHMTRIAPHNGFTWHPHRGVEIYTWVLEGELYHEDTTGGRGVIRAGEFQRMYAGDYIEHQELNRSADPVRVIQIWFAAEPEARPLEPHYQQPARETLPVRASGAATVTHLIGDGSPMDQHMAGRLTATTLPPEGRAPLGAPRPGEDLFLYVTDGAGTAFNGGPHPLGQYDVILATPDVEPVEISAGPDAPLHFLSFYLPTFLG
jgi:redox-sensitive bicupin YhaK (pirin superfamily)